MSFFELCETVRIELAIPYRLNMIPTIWMTSPSPFKSKGPRKEKETGGGLLNQTTMIGAM